VFPKSSKLTLARAALFQNAPVYVQYYITARCNLTCQQCNIIYANSDVRECTLDEITRMADNFRKLGVAMVLLTGGEPFIRQDLPQIVRAFVERGIHVRMQTNGLATEERIHQVVEYGGRDISISLDSLWPSNQEEINGGFARSWHDALRAMAAFTKYLPSEGSFASFGCVLQRDNLGDIEDVIRFGTEVSWFTSLVPIHVTTFDRPMNFRTFDQTKRWKREELPAVNTVIERVRAMREEGYLLYDSDQYLDDIKRFAARADDLAVEERWGLRQPQPLFRGIAERRFRAVLRSPLVDALLLSGSEVPGDLLAGSFSSRRARSHQRVLRLHVRELPGDDDRDAIPESEARANKAFPHGAAGETLAGELRADARHGGAHPHRAARTRAAASAGAGAPACRHGGMTIGCVPP